MVTHTTAMIKKMMPELMDTEIRIWLLRIKTEQWLLQTLMSRNSR
jgi:hypothetical protein